MKRYFYVVECVKLKEENNQIVVDYSYQETTKLFDSLQKAVDYYLKVTSKFDANLYFALIKVSEEKTKETLNNFTFEFDGKTYYYVNELQNSFAKFFL